MNTTFLSRLWRGPVIEAFLVIFLAAVLYPPALLAGRACQERDLGKSEFESAARLARQTLENLQQHDDNVVLLARVGSDLSRFNLTYSHVAVAHRSHSRAPWRVFHLLNHCGSAHSALYQQGLLNFYLDDLHRYQALIVRVPKDLQTRLGELLVTSEARYLHQPRYNMIANWRSQRTQNSNQWVLELLAVTLYQSQASRSAAQDALARHGYEPEVIRIGRLERIAGALTRANVDFGDHSLGTRLRGRYPIVSVRSIFRFLEQEDQIVSTTPLALPAP